MSDIEGESVIQVIRKGVFKTWIHCADYVEQPMAGQEQVGESASWALWDKLLIHSSLGRKVQADEWENLALDHPADHAG